MADGGSGEDWWFGDGEVSVWRRWWSKVEEVMSGGIVRDRKGEMCG